MSLMKEVIYMKFFDFFKRKNAEKYILDGDNYCRNFEYNKALDCYTKAIELQQNNYHYYAYRSFVKKQLNDIDGALQDIDKAISLNPSCDKYYDYRTTLCS